jgi:hypothetical protein
MGLAAVDFDDDVDDEFAIELELGMSKVEVDDIDVDNAARAGAIVGRAAVARSAIRRLHCTHVPAS